VWRLRPAYLHALDRPARAGRWRPRPAVGAQPVRWRERHVVGLLTGSLLRWLPRWLPLAVVALTSGLLAWAVFGNLTGGALIGGAALYAAVMVLGVGLITGLRSAGAITGEQERGTWPLLQLSPIPDGDLVHEKFRGILGACTPWLLAVSVPPFLVALYAGAEWYWLVVFVLVPPHLWFVQRVMIALGLSSSAEAKSTWQSLLTTLLVGLLFGGFLYYQAVVGVVYVTMVGLALFRPLMRGVLSEAVLAATVAAVVVISALLEWIGRKFLAAAVTRVGYAGRILQRRRRGRRPADEEAEVPSW
jgi:ABC-type transport system involved in multi-copper enzyme maturation permease subunit